MAVRRDNVISITLIIIIIIIIILMLISIIKLLFDVRMKRSTCNHFLLFILFVDASASIKTSLYTAVAWRPKQNTCTSEPGWRVTDWQPGQMKDNHCQVSDKGNIWLRHLGSRHKNLLFGAKMWFWIQSSLFLPSQLFWSVFFLLSIHSSIISEQKADCHQVQACFRYMN